jgi:hypothetical protein
VWNILPRIIGQMILDQGHQAIIDNAYKFIFNLVGNFLMPLLLNSTDTGRFNVYLIGKRGKTKDPPGRTIVSVFLKKQFPAPGYDSIVLG